MYVMYVLYVLYEYVCMYVCMYVCESGFPDYVRYLSVNAQIVSLLMATQRSMASACFPCADVVQLEP